MGKAMTVMRFFCQLIGFSTSLCLGCLGIVVLNGLTLGRANSWVNPNLIRLFGRALLWAARVKLVLEPAVVAEFAVSRRRIILLNHSSTLDMFIMTAFWAPGTVAIVKREFIWMPLLGWATLALRFVLLDRRNRERAVASMDQAALRVKRENLGITIAPEGTRSKTGELAKFKQGAFHLAAKAEAPLVPVLLHGPRWLWPRSQMACHPGIVTVRLLPELVPLPPDAPPEAFHAQADAAHAAYAFAIAEMDATVPVQ